MSRLGTEQVDQKKECLYIYIIVVEIEVENIRMCSNFPSNKGMNTGSRLNVLSWSKTDTKKKFC